MEVLEPKKDLNVPHRGVVVENNDPLKCGRVKVTIKGLIEETDMDKLPWVNCINPLDFSGGSGNSINPPEKGSKLRIEFDYDDPYFVVYTGYWQDVTTSPAKADGFNEQIKANYPKVYAYQDSTGNYEIIDKMDGFTERGYASGVKFKVDKDGNVSLKGAKDGVYEYSEKFTAKSNEVKFGNLDNAKHVVLAGHLDKFDRLANALNTFTINLGIMFSALPPPLTPIAAAYASSVLAPFTLSFTTPSPVLESAGESSALTANISSETKLS
jgi:hypothetical protein